MFLHPTHPCTFSVQSSGGDESQKFAQKRESEIVGEFRHPRKEKVKVRVNLSATMLSTEFAAVGQIFADEQPADAFYGSAASCFIDGTKKGFSNCLDS